MTFKVVALYNGVTEITFEWSDREQVVFSDYDAANGFVQSLLNQPTYQRYQFEIVRVQGVHIPYIEPYEEELM
ncbi:hypothetical protein [Pontibacillus litoralis]|uniref:Uncharacterized protein n=1 Tax=Pontibacillus litoralis JSM 072002 TaxID=1385512 RepID=A0A0A5FWG7_9BACI|nr:hypothetical protein [Pontibacillus litoralis]KGX85126.1 hypothetical protein N784_10085 [Pontibacillus litoralis JSM 072002]